MREFKYIIKDPMGFHARPVGMMAKYVNSQKALVTIVHGQKSADCRRLYQVLGLGIKQHEQVIFRIEGENEEVVEKDLLNLFSHEQQIGRAHV